MVSREVGPVLADILDAIDGIQQVTAGKSFAEFGSSWLLRLATQRALEIISEATRHIPDELLAPHADIPWKRIRGIGNVLRHEHHRVADDAVWVVVTDNLAPLRTAIEAIRDRNTE
ncbi:hypothetical protein Sa4125_13560 [Aureimonas sp. SA4125]|uniref:HepT-like ribonuclease domain-containing protein n=1 Tax=Aureimonas sp. SA4125 TaxID=2826993 RepID=UPI001CC5B840|nr:HepT-like ribonuclease domain-containing protein [Aureimonas sp. SA4125]BDA83814.1 hypothetical protein Sa4125_13560 [Aureimonas sp. SA4125]